MKVEDLEDVLDLSAEQPTHARRAEYPVLVDLGSGDPPRTVGSFEWDDEHKALVVVLD